MSDAAYVAIDCGSNSLRMLATDEHGAVVDRYMATTRLGRSIPTHGIIDREASAVAIAALTEIKERIGAARVVAVATSAVRDAANANEFLQTAEAALGAPLEVLSGAEEGRLTFAGAIAGVAASDFPGEVTVIDVGGGSTEVSSGRVRGEPAVQSFQIGCVRLAGTHFATEGEDTRQLTEAARAVRILFGDLAPADSGLVMAVGGTATTIAGYDLKLTEYQPGVVDGYELCLADLTRIVDELAAMAPVERRQHPHLAEGRADVVVPGAVILREVLNRLAVQTCVTSEGGILEGLLFDRFDRPVPRTGRR